MVLAVSWQPEHQLEHCQNEMQVQISKGNNAYIVDKKPKMKRKRHR